MSDNKTLGEKAKDVIETVKDKITGHKDNKCHDHDCHQTGEGHHPYREGRLCNETGAEERFVEKHSFRTGDHCCGEHGCREIHQPTVLGGDVHDRPVVVQGIVREPGPGTGGPFGDDGYIRGGDRMTGQKRDDIPF